jgi:hypothetical protein
LVATASRLFKTRSTNSCRHHGRRLMAEKYWVVNASPLIALAKIGQLELLLAPSRTLLIPEAVAEEIRIGPPQDPARAALTSGFGGTPIPVDVSPEVIAWARPR